MLPVVITNTTFPKMFKPGLLLQLNSSLIVDGVCLLTNYRWVGTPIFGYGREVPQWWPQFGDFQSDWVQCYTSARPDWHSLTAEKIGLSLSHLVPEILRPIHVYCRMNNYIVRPYRDVIVITKFAITKFSTRRGSKAQSIVMYFNIFVLKLHK